MTGVILCGGENTRIPVLKGFLKVEGRTIIERSIDVLKKVVERVVISTNEPERYFSLGLPMVGDVRREKCPMTGILSALTATSGDAIFVVACDMPFLNEKLMRYMVKEQMAEGMQRGYDAVVPVFGGEKEPLFGIYTGATIHAIESTFRVGERRITEMLKDLRARYVTEDEVKALDPSGESFVNINTVEDYKRIGGKTCLV